MGAASGRGYVGDLADVAVSQSKKDGNVDTKGPLLVITAHPGDFVWRAGGAIALAARSGQRAVIACLSFSERGESAALWRKGHSLDEVKAVRREEAEKAAGALGAEVVFFDAGDYPLVETPALTRSLVDLYPPGGCRGTPCGSSIRPASSIPRSRCRGTGRTCTSVIREWCAPPAGFSTAASGRART